MGELKSLHKNLNEGTWETLGFKKQMGNIGSEISRAIKWQEKNRDDRMRGAVDRALELIDLSINSTNKSTTQAELCRAREEICDYFIGDNTFMTNPKKMLAYYDQFALAR